MPYEDQLLFKAVTYEVSYDKHVHIRQVRTVTDRISLIGGLIGALMSFCYILVTLSDLNGQYLYLMKELFVDPT